MDPLSIATSTASLVVLTGKVIYQLDGIIQQIRSVDEEVNGLYSETRSLMTVTLTIQRTCNKYKAILAGDSADLWVLVEQNLNDCDGTLTRLLAMLGGVKEESIWKRGMFKKPMTALSLSRRMKDIVAHREQVRSYGNALQLALSMINLHLQLERRDVQQDDAKLQGTILRRLQGLKHQIEELERSTSTVNDSQTRLATEPVRQLIRSAKSLHSTTASTVYGGSTVYNGSVMGDPLSQDKFETIRNWIPPKPEDERLDSIDEEMGSLNLDPPETGSSGSSHYEVLAIHPSSSAEQIGQSFLKMIAWTTSSDGRYDQERMKDLNLAYYTLSDPARRRQYDDMLETRKQDSPPPSIPVTPVEVPRSPQSAYSTNRHGDDGGFSRYSPSATNRVERKSLNSNSPSLKPAARPDHGRRASASNLSSQSSYALLPQIPPQYRPASRPSFDPTRSPGKGFYPPPPQSSSDRYAPPPQSSPLGLVYTPPPQSSQSTYYTPPPQGHLINYPPPAQRSAKDPPQWEEYLINNIISVKGNLYLSNNQLPETQIIDLCQRAKEVFLSQPTLLEFEAPVKLFGDIHGHFADLLWHFDSWGHPGPNAKFLFLGNYTGNGEQSLGTLCLLLAYKVKYPETFYMLRGSNETSITNNPDIVHFRNQMKKQYSSRLCDVVQECFDSLPLAAVVDEKIFAVHSGLSPELIYVEQIRSIKLPLHIPPHGLLHDLLFACPVTTNGGGWSGKNTLALEFGADVLSSFLEKNDFDLVLRGHRQVQEGYEFFANRMLVTLFSARNFDGSTNDGAIIETDENLTCTFRNSKSQRN